MAERIHARNLAYDPEVQAHYAMHDLREGALEMIQRTVRANNQVTEDNFQLEIITNNEGFTTLASLQTRPAIASLQRGDEYWVIMGRALKEGVLVRSPIAAVVARGEVIFELPGFDTEKFLENRGIILSELR